VLYCNHGSMSCGAQKTCQCFMALRWKKMKRFFMKIEKKL